MWCVFENNEKRKIIPTEFSIELGKLILEFTRAKLSTTKALLKNKKDWPYQVMDTVLQWRRLQEVGIEINKPTEHKKSQTAQCPRGRFREEVETTQ